MKRLLFILCCFGMTLSFSQSKLSKNKKAVIASVEKHKQNLIKISDDIWALAETAFEEHQSSKILSDYAESQGMTVERGVAGMPTAFVHLTGIQAFPGSARLPSLLFPEMS